MMESLALIPTAICDELKQRYSAIEENIVPLCASH